MPTTARWAIPYPAAADPPNLPAQMEAMALNLESMGRDTQGLFANRPTPGITGRIYWATDHGVTYYDDGTEWRVVYKGELRTDLKIAAPTDHQVVHVLMDANAGTVWTFRYRAAEATYKWIFVGGSPLMIWRPNSTEHTVNTTAYATLSFGGLAQVTLPFAGVYEIEYGANIYNFNNSALTAISPIIPPASVAVDNDAIQTQAVGNASFPVNIQTAHHHNKRVLRKTLTVAGTVILQGKVAAGTSGTVRGIHIAVRPVQVAGNVA